MTLAAVTAAPTEPALVEWQPIRFHQMMLDGRWWPESRAPGVELPGLVRAVDDARGRVVRLLLSAAGWATRPHQVTVAGRTVTLGYFAERPPAMITAICADGSTVTLLVEPVGARAGFDAGQNVWEGEGGRLAAPRRRR
jgi:hypothetical protein